MKERPILFNSWMVLAILEGRKTQTRRVLKMQPLDILPMAGDFAGKTWVTLDTRGDTPDGNRGSHIRCRYGVAGDRLWVRETWARICTDYPCQEHDNDRYHIIEYRADTGNSLPGGWPEEERGDPVCPRWRSSIHMPRWASRITLEIERVRIQRLQEISEEDAQAEGITRRGEWWDAGVDWEGDGLGETATEAFRYLWGTINGKRSHSWERNPWVWVIEFRRVNVGDAAATQIGGGAGEDEGKNVESA